jgi:arylsulfatase A-like enzyme
MFLYSFRAGQLVAALALAPVFLIPTLAPAQTAPPPVPKNIILILTDDQDQLLGSPTTMPYLNSLLVANGTTFANSFVPLSLCCPSRSSILRGQYPHNTQILSNGPPLGGFQKFHDDGLESATIGTALKTANYRTGFMGKYLNGYPGSLGQTYYPTGWDQWVSPVDGSPYSEYNYYLNENGVVTFHAHTPADYLTDVLRQKAVDFVSQPTPVNQPFFLYLAPYAPHKPATPARRHKDLFQDVQAPRTASFNEPDVSDKPSYIRNLCPLDADEIANIDDLYRDRLRSLQAVDEMIAAVVQALATAGKLADTYIFFTSDNGFHLGQHRLNPGKYTPYETDIRVPLVVRGPNVQSGVSTDSFAINIDLAATFFAIAGAIPGWTVDGRSLLPILQGSPVTSWRRNAFVEQATVSAASPAAPTDDTTLEPPDTPPDATPAPTTPGFKEVRTATYELVQYDTGEKELYRVGSDPDNTCNVAAWATANAPGFVNALTSLLTSFGTCAGASCRAVENFAAPAFPPGVPTCDHNPVPCP